MFRGWFRREEKPSENPARIDRSGNEQWKLCDSKTDEVLMAFWVPPQNQLVVEIPPWFGVDREVEWWVTRTTRPGSDSCTSYGTQHYLLNQSSPLAEASEGDSRFDDLTDAEWERLGDQ